MLILNFSHPSLLLKTDKTTTTMKYFQQGMGRDFDVDYNFLKIILAHCAIQNDIGVIVEDLHVPIPARNIFTYLKPYNLQRNFLRVSCIYADSIALGEQISQISQTSQIFSNVQHLSKMDQYSLSTPKVVSRLISRVCLSLFRDIV